jgi:hypothetical protein
MSTSAQIKANNAGLIADKTEEGSILKTDVSGQLDEIVDFVGYNELAGMLSQAGSANPVFTSGKNTTGINIQFARSGVGTYLINIPGYAGFAVKPSVVISPQSYAAKELRIVQYNSAENIVFKTYNVTSSAFEDDMLINTPVSVKVFP